LVGSLIQEFILNKWAGCTATGGAIQAGAVDIAMFFVALSVALALG